MNVVIWTPFPFKSHSSNRRNFIVETFTFLAKQHSTEHFYFLTTAQTPIPFAPNIIQVDIEKAPSNPILKKMWDIKLSRRIKKLKTDLFISLVTTSPLLADIPNCIILDGTTKPKQSYLKDTGSIIVLNNGAKEYLIEKYKLPGEKTSVVYPFSSKIYGLSDFETKQRTKMEYSEGNEFFLYNSSFAEKENFINLLKSFSHFKKRQKSSFQLLICSESNSFQKSLEGYKYRNDIKFISEENEKQLALVTAAAYAVILPFNTNNDILAALNSMRSGVPVITTKNSAISEVTGDAALYTESNTIKEIGDKLMQIYTNEDLRFALIEKGKAVAETFTLEKTAGCLWQAVMKSVQ